MEFLKRLLSFTISFSLVANQTLMAGGLSVDTSAPISNQPNIQSARNGVPVINIVKPTSSGLSHNKFSNYNVDKQGLILNNSNKNMTNTQLAGYIFGNKNLSNSHTASTILNEVTSVNPTSLLGFTEVAGDRANVVVANPNGIYINGAGFINTPKATLVTATPHIINGNLDSYRVTNGVINIDGKGINLTNVNSAQLYANAIKINAKIYANGMDMVTGDNVISSNGDITPLDKKRDSNGFSIDSTLLGGIYANKIKLIGTSKGVGVNLPIEIQASNSLTLSANGDINFKKAVVKNSANIEGKSIDMDTLYANTSTIHASDTIKSSGELRTNEDMSISANNLINSSKLISNKNLLMNVNTLTNNHLISASNALHINADKFIVNNDTHSKEFGIRGGSVSLYTDDLINHSLLLATNEMTLHTNNLTNYGGVALLNSNSDSLLHIDANNLTNYNTIYSNANINLLIKDTLLNQTNSSQVDVHHQKASIYADKHINIGSSTQKTNEVINDKARVQTHSGDISFYANSLKNTTDEPIIKGVYNPTNNSVSGVPFKHISSNRIYRGGSSNNYDIVDIYLAKMELQSRSFSADIISGGDINLFSDDITNQFSQIMAKDDIYFHSKLLNNKDKKIVKVTKQYTQIYRDRRKCKHHCLAHEHVADYKGTRTHKDVEVIDTIGSNIYAGGKIKGVSDGVKNGTPSNAFSSYTPHIPTSFKKDISLKNGSSEFLLPSNKFALFTPVSPDKHLDYLIESNPLYTNSSNYISSSYFLSRLEYKADRVSKRLGDGFFEISLVRDSIIKQTGRRYLSSYTNDIDQYRALMDNGVNLKNTMHLHIGKPLSTTQIHSLKKDIVWLEERVVMGKKVLIPVVYLASHTKRASGATIAAKKSINVKAKKITNASNIQADHIAIDADTITNTQGVLLADNEISLIAKDNIVNKNGSTIKGGSVKIVSQHGDIINDTFVKQVKSGDSNDNRTYTQVGKRSSIQSTKQDLILQADKDIINGAGILQSSKDIKLQATNINLNAKELKDELNHIGGQDFYKQTTTSHITSSIKANNDIQMSANKDISIQSANIQANNDLTLQGNSVDIQAVNDVEYLDVQNSSSGFLSKSVSRDMSYKQTVKGSTLKGKNIIIKADDTVSIKGSSIEANNKLGIASNHIDISAQGYASANAHYSKKSSFGGMKSSLDMDTNKQLHLKSSSLKTANGDILLLAKDDINIKASQIDSGKTIGLKAFNGVNIVSQDELSKTDSIHKSSSFNLTNIALGLASLGMMQTPLHSSSIFTQDIDKKGSYAHMVKSSSIKANGDIKIDSGSTKIEASNLDTQKNIYIKADTGKIEIVDGVNSLDESRLDKHVDVKMSSVSDIANSAKEQIKGDTKLKLQLASASYDKQSIKTTSKTTTASSLKALKNIILNGSDDVDIKGFDMQADKIGIVAKNVNLLNGTESQEVSKYNSSAKGKIYAKLDDDNMKIRAEVNNKAQTTNTQKTIVKNSSIKTSNMVIKATNNVNITSVNLGIANNALIEAKNDLHILTAKNNTITSSSSSEANIGLEMGIDYNLGEAMNSLKGVKDSISNIGSTFKATSGLIGGVMHKNGLNEILQGNEKGINNASSLISNYQALQGGPNMSGGVYATVSYNKNSSTQKSSSDSINFINVGKNLTLTTKNGDMSLKGVRANVANDTTITTAKGLHIIAAESELTSKDETLGMNGSVNVVTGDFNANLSTSKNKNKGTHHMNSYLNTGNKLTIKAKEDIDVIGSNINAKKADIQTDKNLNVRSIADNSKQTSNAYNVGISSSSASLGVDTTQASSHWVAKQAGIKTQDTLKLDVGSNTDLKGAYLASDKQVELNTKTISYKNIQEHKKSKTLAVGFGGSKDKKNANLAYATQGTRRVTKATITNANVHLKDQSKTALKNINTNLQTAQTITKNLQVGRIDTKYALKSQKLKDEEKQNSWSKTGEALGTASANLVNDIGTLDNRLTDSLDDEKVKSVAKNINDTISNGYEVATNTINTLSTKSDFLGILPNKANSGGIVQNMLTIHSGDLAIQTKDGKPVMHENGKFYEVNSDGKKVKVIEKIDVVYNSGMMNNAKDTQKGFKELINKTILDEKKGISINNPTHGAIADGIESLIGWLGIPTGNAFQMASIKEDLQKQTISQESNIIMLNHSQANIVDKNSNSILKHRTDAVKLDNIYVYSFGAPEYSGKDQGDDNTLDNSHNSVGSHFMQGFNNNHDFVSFLGFNSTHPYKTTSPKEAEQAKEAGHKIEEYQPWLRQNDVNNTIYNIYK